MVTPHTPSRCSVTLGGALSRNYNTLRYEVTFSRDAKMDESNEALFKSVHGFVLEKMAVLMEEADSLLNKTPKNAK